MRFNVSRRPTTATLCALAVAVTLALSARPVHAQPGWVLSHQKISDTQGGFTGTLDNEILSGNRSNLAFTGRHFRQNRSSVVNSGRDSLSMAASDAANSESRSRRTS